MATDPPAQPSDQQKSVGIIPLHFDVPTHILPLNTFIETAARTKDIVEAFNRSLFDGRLVYEIYVLTPEDGSFKSKLAVYVISGATAVAVFAESDMGKAFVEGLTNHPPDHYFREAGKYIRKTVIDLASQPVEQPHPTVADPDHDAAKRDGSTAILVETTKSFLQKDRSELRKIGVDERKFRDAYEARNEFYIACSQNRQIQALGFEEEPVFPIKRADFARLQVALGPKEDVPQIDNWIVEIVTLSVTSPNWDREDRNRTWKGKDANKKERNFSIEDEYFWTLVRDRQINPSIIDTMKMQWAFVTDKRRTPRVLKVLEYNAQVLGEPLDENALKTLLGLYTAAANANPGLFDRR
ncbi:MAG: hypothetical protein JNM89_01250 [Hyphomicrobiaceae bacterium]|nr:hypothetical protein [Hyphomicrobiaceae bacterium]